VSALPKFTTLRKRVFDDARFANWQAHLESPEVPQWVEEMNDPCDMVYVLGDALSDIEDKRRDKLNDLLTKLCEDKDGLCLREAEDLHNYLQQALTEYCIRQAQKMVDNNLGYGSNEP
jgi:hypothetical protein